MNLNPTIIRLMRLSWPFYSYDFVHVFSPYFSLCSWCACSLVSRSLGDQKLMWPTLQVWALSYCDRSYGSFLHCLLLAWSRRFLCVCVRSLEGGAWAPEGVSPNGVPKPHEYWNLPWYKQLPFDFIAYFPVCKKEIFLWECGGMYKIGN
jgi:hypothetical protein